MNMSSRDSFPVGAFSVDRYALGDTLGDTPLGKVTTTTLYSGSFTNPISSDLIKREMLPDPVTEKLAETIARDAAFILSRNPEDLLCNWARAEEQVTITEAEARHVNTALEACRQFLEAAGVEEVSAAEVCFESAVRALVRYCTSAAASLTQQAEAAAVASC